MAIAAGRPRRYQDPNRLSRPPHPVWSSPRCEKEKPRKHALSPLALAAWDGEGQPHPPLTSRKATLSGSPATVAPRSSTRARVPDSSPHATFWQSSTNYFEYSPPYRSPVRRMSFIICPYFLSVTH